MIPIFNKGEIRFMSVDLKSEEVMEAYTYLFFSPEGQEKKYVLHILNQYVQNNFQATRHEFSEYLASAAASGGVKYRSIFNILDRYIILYWEQYAENWNRYLNWKEQLSPSPSRALRLFCEKYATFFPVL